VTLAFSFAKFTIAATLSIALTFFSTLVAHVIPWTESSTTGVEMTLAARRRR
jgi:hypothetical protein